MTLQTLAEKFPPLPIDELVSEIGAFSGKSEDAKQAFLRRLVMAHPIVSLDWGGGWRYRRARPLQSDEAISNADDTIWNKKSRPKLGRANPEGFSVIYLADRVDTALGETHIDDQSVLLSEFQILRGQSLRIAPLGEFSQIQRTGRGLMTGDASQAVSNALNASERDQVQSILIADAFLLEVLTNREDDYALSSTIAKAVFEKLPEVKAVAFPSTRTRGGLCFAVRTDDFWQTWGILSVRRVRATHLAMGYYRLTEGHHVTDITDDGTLVWEDKPDRADIVLAFEPLWTPP